MPATPAPVFPKGLGNAGTIVSAEVVPRNQTRLVGLWVAAQLPVPRGSVSCHQDTAVIRSLAVASWLLPGQPENCSGHSESLALAPQ